MKLSCVFHKRNLTAYVDRELPIAAAARLEAHLKTCSGCSREVAELRALNKLAAAPPLIEPSPDFDRLFWARLAREREQAAQSPALPWPACAKSFFTSPAGLSLSAAMAMAVFIASLYFMRPRDPMLQQPELMAAADLELYANLEVIENTEALENFELIEMLAELQQDERG